MNRHLRLFGTALLGIALTSTWAAQVQKRGIANHLPQVNKEAASRIKPPSGGFNIWGKFHQDNLNSGVGCYGGSNGLLKWKKSLGSSPVLSSPAINHAGVSYVGSADHNIYAINPDGTVNWTANTGGPIGASPTLDSFG